MLRSSPPIITAIMPHSIKPLSLENTHATLVLMSSLIAPPPNISTPSRILSSSRHTSVMDIPLMVTSSSTAFTQSSLFTRLASSLALSTRISGSRGRANSFTLVEGYSKMVHIMENTPPQKSPFTMLPLEEQPEYTASGIFLSRMPHISFMRTGSGISVNMENMTADITREEHHWRIFSTSPENSDGSFTLNWNCFIVPPRLSFICI